MITPLEDVIYKGDMFVTMAYSLINEHTNVVLVDVRTPQEWLESGYPDLKKNHEKLIKINIDDNFTYNLSLRVVDKKTKILFLCAQGYRSKRAAILMTKIGYDNCYNVVGGINEWKNLGFPCSI